MTLDVYVLLWEQAHSVVQCECVWCVFGEQQVWRAKSSSREGNTQQDLGVWH